METKKITLNEESEGFKAIKEDWHEKAHNCKSLKDFDALYTELFEGYKHDYGTICHAIVAMMRAAFHMCDNSEQGGITGFQANCIMWQLLFKEFYNSNELGLRLIDYDYMLYPQHEDHFKLKISKKTAENLKVVAQKRLDSDVACVDVKEHWKKLANGELPFGITIREDE